MVQYTVHPLTKLSHPFLDSSAVHRSSYRLTYRRQQLRSELIQLSSRHIQLRSTPMHGKLEAFLLWVAKQYSHSWPYPVVCPQLDGVSYWDTVSQLFHLCAIIGQWLQNNSSIPYPIRQHIVKSGNGSRVHYLSWTPHFQLELKTTNQKPRLKNVFVWNCFLIIHLHLTWVSMGTGARTSLRGTVLVARVLG